MSLHAIQHETISKLYWAENPKLNLSPANFNSRLEYTAAKALRAANLGLANKAIDQLVINPEPIIGLGMESIVVLEESGESVTKYMFIMKGDPEIMADRVRDQYEMTKHYLGAVAVDTEISVKEIKFFKIGKAVKVVTQKQPYLNPRDFNELFSSEAYQRGAMPDTMRRDLGAIVSGWKSMKDEEGIHNDISTITTNLFLGTDGSVQLVDILPMPVSGPRLAGDNPPRLSQLATIEEIEEKLADYA